MNSRLAPGIYPLRRRARQLQIGLDPSHAIELPEEPIVLDELARLAGDVTAPKRIRAQTLGQLHPLLRPTTAPTLTVHLVEFGHPDRATLVEHVTALVQAHGHRVSRKSGDLTVVIGHGEPPREVSDRLQQQQQPCLWVRFREGVLILGPFVVPGLTSCLRCIDAHHTDQDECWPLLIAQYVDLCQQNRADGTGQAHNPLLWYQAAASVAAEVQRMACDELPLLWSATQSYGPRLGAQAPRHWLRHPACGCAWTMEE